MKDKIRRELKYFIAFFAVSMLIFSSLGYTAINHERKQLQIELRKINRKIERDNARMLIDSVVMLFYPNIFRAIDNVDTSLKNAERVDTYNRKVIKFKKSVKLFWRTAISLSLLSSIPYVILIPFRLRKSAD